MNMSDNELEALHEKGIAESLIVKKDYLGAMDRLLKAQQLFPGLDHIDAMIIVCDVLLEDTDLTQSSGIDCYRILLVRPSSPLSYIHEQYKTLLSMLKPIYNKFPGTELALELIHHAHNVLMDEDKRLAFDSRRNSSLADHDSLPLKRLYDQSIPCHDAGAALPDRIASVEVFGEMDGSIITRNIEGDAAENINRDVIVISPPGHLCISPNEDQSDRLKAMAEEVLGKDFYDFQSDRILKNIEPGQIWAVRHQLKKVQNYCYARIVANANSAVSVLWLRPAPVNDEERRWSGAGMPLACGSFCLDMEMGEQVCSPAVFSHPINSQTSTPLYKIYPLKEEIWAMYRNWNSKWKHSDYENCQYWVSEILSDFSEGERLTVVRLGEVKGFPTFFHRLQIDGVDLVHTISRTELPIFSHQIPSFQVPGIGFHGIPESSWHLEPNGLPLKKAFPDYVILE